MSRRALACALSLALSVPVVAVMAEDARPAPPLPTDPERWVGEPASWASLRGRVTLLFVWTFG